MGEQKNTNETVYLKFIGDGNGNGEAVRKTDSFSGNADFSKYSKDEEAVNKSNTVGNADYSKFKDTDTIETQSTLETKIISPERINEQKKEAKRILGNVILDELKKQIKENNFKSPAGYLVKNNTEEFYDSEIYLMGTIVAKDIFENEDIHREIIDAKQKGEKWKINESERQKIVNVVDQAFSNGEMDRAAYIAYEYRTVGEQLNKNEKIKRRIAKSRSSNKLSPEMDEAENRELTNRIMQELSLDKDRENQFVTLRIIEHDAVLNSDERKAITDVIRNCIYKEFLIQRRVATVNKFEEEPIAPAAEDIIKDEQKVIDKVEEQQILPTVDDITNGLEKKEFEISKEILEEDLIRAMHEIEVITADELEIDFIPIEIEKHFSGNLKDKMESLLNRSAFIDAQSAEAEEYFKELSKLHKIATEINDLDKNGMVCVVYQDNTYFINKKQETALQELAEITKHAIGKENLDAFIFGISGDFNRYVSELKTNRAWKDLEEIKRKELLEKGVAYFTDEVLDENNIPLDAKKREQIYKYVFTILIK